MSVQRSWGTVFNGIADQYDRHRPAYPAVLVDRACQVAGVAPGAQVLEIGCGTGQLTRSLLARGLRVTAVEPGEQLIARARERLQGLGDVRFLNARLEDITLPEAHFNAAFCASAIHWVDPEVSWRKVAGALRGEGALALLSYVGLDDPRSDEDQRALHGALVEIAPDLAVEWPTYRDLDTTLEGARARRDNVSGLWGWLVSRDVGRQYAEALFEEAQLTVEPTLLEHTAEGLNALLGTMSFWTRLSPGQRAALAEACEALQQRLGRPIRSSAVACLVTARRRLT